MRNLKKFLALVLAMVMAFSLMLSAGAVKYDDYGDKAEIKDAFKEAVQVLTGLEIMQGDENGFRPEASISRAEAAAVIYRVATRDVKDAQVSIYKDYGNFTDVNPEDWFAGYVGYCQNAGYIKGKSPTRFSPYETVTGYEMLTMLLRVVGYGQENEFTGGEWQVKVAARSKDLHITDNVTANSFSDTLNYAASRQVVADLVFQTLATVPTVEHNALGYSDRISLTSDLKNPTLGQKNFGLYVTGWTTVDNWGTPGYKWYKGGTQLTFSNGNWAYDDNRMPVYGGAGIYNPGSLGLIDTGTNAAIATIKPEPTKVYNTANIRECDVAHDLEFDESELFNLFVNSKTVTTNKYRVEATDTVTRVGGQGRETKFWYGYTSKFVGKVPNTCTMVDTFLAQVTKVTEIVVDHNNHLIKPAELHLNVYDLGNSGDYTTGTVNTIYNHNGAINDATSGTEADDYTQHIATQDTNWSYSVGDFVLVKGHTDKTQDEADTDNNTKLNHVLANDTQAAIEKTAFETNMLLDDDDDDALLNVLHKVTPVTGKQTITYWNTGKHQVDGEDKDDAMTLYMNYAGTVTNSTFAWYYDDNGNIIGVGPVPNTVNYGVITSIYSSLNNGDSSTDGTAKAVAHVKYADGTEADVVINRFLTSLENAWTNGHNEPGTNAFGTSMKKGSNTAKLIPVYDYNPTGTEGITMTATDTAGTSAVASDQGYLHVAPVASVNKAMDTVGKDSTGTEDGHFGIILGNMFKFIASVDGEVTAIEVAGDGSNDTVYVDNYNIEVSGTAGNNKLVKNLGYITTANSGSNVASRTIWVDNGTKFMVRVWDGAKATDTVVCYDGLSNVPSDITIHGDEIDYADVDNDGRAEYVYFTGEVNGSITYGLFYYNGGAAQWSNVSKTGTIAGWLNGEATTVTFVNETEFRLVQNSQSYDAHIFALQLTDGVVSKVMEGLNSESGSTYGQYLLYDNDGTAYPGGTTVTSTTIVGDWTNKIQHSASVWATKFGLGSVNSAYGNPYSTTTSMVYYRDGDGTVGSGTSVVNYEKGNTVYGTVKVGGDYYTITPNTKIIGIGMGVTHGEAVLEYLDYSTKNDVTIVYENDTMKSVLEIYVATDPNITPSGNTASVSYEVELNSSGYAQVTRKVNGVGTALASGKTATATLKIYTQNGVLVTGGTFSLSFNDTSLDANGRWWQDVNAALANSGTTYYATLTTSETGTTVFRSEPLFKN